TAAHDPLTGYVPIGLSIAEAGDLRAGDPDGYVERAKASMAEEVSAMLAMKKRGAEVFDYGNNIRAGARDAVNDKAVLAVVPGDPDLHKWIALARERVAFQGLPARICWLGYGDRAKVGLAFNELVRTGRVKAPLVIGRDHLDCGSVASPYRETEDMKDGSDAIADWPLLNAMVNTAAGASWVSLHHGGGVGIGLSIHAGMVVVADGTAEAARRIERVLTTDPGTGVLRHADAGYEAAVDFAREHGVHVPHRA